MNGLTPSGEIVDMRKYAVVSYYILRRELFRLRYGDVMPDAWEYGSWVKRPFEFGVETSGRSISEREAEEWIQEHRRFNRTKLRRVQHRDQVTSINKNAL